ncbi:integrase catalytic domain-containing protein [Pseudoxanthomonas mexicana]
MSSHIKAGQPALYLGERVMVEEWVGHDQVLVTAGTDIFQVGITQLHPIGNAVQNLQKTALVSIPADQWSKAAERCRLLRSVSDDPDNRSIGIARVAKELGVSERQAWRLFKVFRNNPTVKAMVQTKAGRRVGCKVLPAAVERVIDQWMQEFYFTPERPSIQQLHAFVAADCRKKGLSPPCLSAVTTRVKNQSQNRSNEAGRIGSKNAKYKFQAMPGHVDAKAPLERVEIDHTPLDVMVRSDEPRWDYIGRPWLTVAIDVYTRCVLGIHIGFEPPSVLSVALCLTHCVLPKNPEEEFGVPMEWPMAGLPKEIVVDNGRDFTSEAFARGCEQYGILLTFRPKGSPHYGGTIERLIGTMVGKCHMLPGTTKNSVVARGDYESRRKAVMTLSEFRTWFVEQLLGSYHHCKHDGIRMPPASKWALSTGAAHEA